jgi:hypothetical protein
MAAIASAFVTAVVCLVHADCPVRAAEAAKVEKAQKPKGEQAYTGKLPGNVEEMREHILAAVQAGDISELKTAIEWNELKPDFGDEAKYDPIAYWKKISADGEGRETLAAVANILALPPARLAIGKDPRTTSSMSGPILPSALSASSVRPSRSISIASSRPRPLSPCRKRISGRGGALPSAPMELGIRFVSMTDQTRA